MIPSDALYSKFLIKTNYVCRVVAVHPETQTVDVVPEVLEYKATDSSKRVLRNEFGREVQVMPMTPDVIYDVPFKTFRFGQFKIRACPEVGDTGYISVFVDDIREWKEKGGFVEPLTLLKFNKDSCVFDGFIANQTNKDEEFPKDNSTLDIVSKNIKITISDGENGATLTISNPNGETIVETQKATVTAETFEITGNVSVDGEITATGDVKAGEVSLTNHTHPFNYVGAGQGSTPQTGTTQKAS